eukprot:SAG11_NODE_3959_length_2132_cov_1.651254_3_plen_238_part_00
MHIRCHFDLLRLLTTRSFDRRQQEALLKADALGRTALHVAAEADASDAVATLLAAGADPSIRTRAGLSVREVAVANGANASLALLPQLDEHCDDGDNGADLSVPKGGQMNHFVAAPTGGGWLGAPATPEVAAIVGDGGCDKRVAVRAASSLSWAEFRDNYISKRRPLILTLEGGEGAADNRTTSGGGILAVALSGGAAMHCWRTTVKYPCSRAAFRTRAMLRKCTSALARLLSFNSS